MSRTAHLPKRPNITDVRRSLTPVSRRLLDATIAVASEEQRQIWLVGGAIRDSAMGFPVQNVDVSVDGAPAPLAESVARLVGGDVRRFPTFGTATVSVDHDEIDFAWLRTERYSRPAALPAVTPGATIEEDLARRDFSVNAIALGLTGPRRREVVDPFDGLADLAARRLRVLHDRSFIDDPTRIWRAARYAARLRLRLDDETAELLAIGVGGLRRLSSRRLWAELERAAGERRTLATFRLLDEWRVLKGSGGDLAFAPEAQRALRHRPGPHAPALLLALLLAPLRHRNAAIARLAPPRSVRDVVSATARLRAAATARDGAAIDVEAFEASDADVRKAALWLDPEGQRPLQRDLRRWERTRSPLDAIALMRMGYEPGPVLGTTLRRLRRERYLGNLSSAADARRALAPTSPATGDREGSKPAND
ncbi:MAG TPA: hypothetical protein QF624_09890 [Dehalococcoidia bacterium]|nr:hypothetical protein [Dehalococcoidia bacterium]